ncbi:MAG: hypothetical protein SGPRY_008656 [Prymnesium sp.]
MHRDPAAQLARRIYIERIRKYLGSCEQVCPYALSYQSIYNGCCAAQIWCSCMGKWMRSSSREGLAKTMRT